MKVLYPRKVFLLRGNHELESVCGNTEYYGEGSFRSQLLNLAVKCNCLNIFGASALPARLCLHACIARNSIDFPLIPSSSPFLLHPVKCRRGVAVIHDVL